MKRKKKSPVLRLVEHKDCPSLRGFVLEGRPLKVDGLVIQPSEYRLSDLESLDWPKYHRVVCLRSLELAGVRYVNTLRDLPEKDIERLIGLGVKHRIVLRDVINDLRGIEGHTHCPHCGRSLGEGK